jgi:large subunit ribosomal protein L13
MNTTVRIKQSQVYKDWHVIDAAGRPLGRVATEVAFLLKGKHKVTYEPHLDDGDFVIVINASQVRVSGNKAQQIEYHSHSGYPGGLKTRSYAVQLDKFPERVLEKAIWGMLPKGPLGKQMFKHLKVYKHANHPHQSQLAGSQKAKEAREAATAELATAPLKVKRLRPLSVRVIEEVAAPSAKAPSPAAAAAREARARVRQEAAAAPVEAEEATPVVPEVEAAVAPPAKTRTRKAAAAPAPETVGTEAPKRAPRRKVATPEAPAEEAAAETPKPARRRAAAKSEGTEE